MISEKFKNTYKICLLILQHASVDTTIIKVVKNLSISMLSTCQDSMYQNCIDLNDNNYIDSNGDNYRKLIFQVIYNLH